MDNPFLESLFDCQVLKNRHSQRPLLPPFNQRSLFLLTEVLVLGSKALAEEREGDEPKGKEESKKVCFLK